MFRLHNSSMPLTGRVVRARVLSADKRRVVLDTGAGVGWMTPRELNAGAIAEAVPGPRPSPDAVLPGDMVDVLMEYLETPEGRPLLASRQSAREGRTEAIWAELQRRFQAGENVRGRVLNQIPGGYAVGIGGLVAFMPHHVATWQTQQRLGELREFRITAMKAERRNVVVFDARSKFLQPRERSSTARDVKREAEALKVALGMPTEGGAPEQAQAPPSGESNGAAQDPARQA